MKKTHIVDKPVQKIITQTAKDLGMTDREVIGLWATRYNDSDHAWIDLQQRELSNEIKELEAKTQSVRIKREQLTTLRRRIMASKK